MAEPVKAVFRRPFDQQVAAFRGRLGDLVPTARWDDIEREAHGRAFMVAGAVKADLLADLAASVDRAIAEGTGLEAFRKDFRAAVKRNDWHGWTGEGTAKGEAWRTRVIYRTNMITSFAAGRHAQLVDGAFAFWVYRHSGAEHPRLDHLSWNGIALPPDHPFWAEHYPPNGWLCGCKVRGARTRAGIRRVGGDPDKKLSGDWTAIDAKTGAPVGVGKGWDYAPGASISGEIQAVSRKLVKWPYDLGKAYMTALPPAQADAVAQAYRRLPSLADDLRRYAERAVGERNGAPITGPVIQGRYRTLGMLTTDQARDHGAKLGADLAGYDFTLDSNAVTHVIARHGDAVSERRRGQVEFAPADFPRLLDLLDEPDKAIKVGSRRLQLEKVINGVRYVAIFEIRSKRKLLSLVTMWRVGRPEN